jgi:hypothetical protein
MATISGWNAFAGFILVMNQQRMVVNYLRLQKYFMSVKVLQENVRKRCFFVTLITVGVVVSINILFLFCGILNDNFSSSHHVTSDYRMVKYCKWCRMKRSKTNLGLLSQHLPGGTADKHEWTHSDWPPSGPRFETVTSKTQNAKHSFSISCVSFLLYDSEPVVISL